MKRIEKKNIVILITDSNLVYINVKSLWVGYHWFLLSDCISNFFQMIYIVDF